MALWFYLINALSSWWAPPHPLFIPLIPVFLPNRMAGPSRGPGLSVATARQGARRGGSGVNLREEGVPGAAPVIRVSMGSGVDGHQELG